VTGYEPPARKKLRIGHGAINACRALLERHGLVVHEVDARADYGRDLLVDLIENGEITGAVAGIQVKGDRRFFRDNATWVLSASPKDARFWADSSIPVVGVLWDRHAGNLSPRHTAPRWTLPAVHGRPTPWTRAATSPPLVGCSAGNPLLAVDRRTKRNPESRRNEVDHFLSQGCRRKRPHPGGFRREM